MVRGVGMAVSEPLASMLVMRTVSPRSRWRWGHECPAGPGRGLFDRLSDLNEMMSAVEEVRCLGGMLPFLGYPA